MKNIFLIILFVTLNLTATAKESKSEGDNLFEAGQYESAAKWYAGKNTSHDLLCLAKSLEKMSDQINTTAERKCFRSKGGGGGECMKKYAESLNEIYGPGSFEYAEHLVFIRYTGAHYKKIEEGFPKSDEAAEAAYMNLTKNLVGHPDAVLPRITLFLKKYPDGEWHRKSLLLWARINEDIWWIHRKWSWVLYNWTLSEEELIVKAEPYRQEALKTFEQMIKKHSNTDEGKAAKMEYELLKKYQDDGRLYGIINEASVEGVKAFR